MSKIVSDEQWEKFLEYQRMEYVQIEANAKASDRTRIIKAMGDPGFYKPWQVLDKLSLATLETIINEAGL